MVISQLKQLELESISRKIPIIGSEKGRWLLQKVEELKPQKILELGTANGYSGIILASKGAELTTVELNPKIVEEAQDNFKRFNVNAKIIIGDGVEEIKKLDEQFDLIFIDFAKKKYFQVLNDCLRLIKIGGHIIADNISFDKCQDFKEAVLNHPQLKTEIIEIKDGLSCSEKINWR
jgi:predicted O-methyltransferase YrrM